MKHFSTSNASKIRTNSGVVEQNILRTPVALDLVLLEVLHQGSPGSVDDALGLPGGAARVHDEERVVEGQLLEPEDVSLGVRPAQVQEFGKGDLLPVSAKLDLGFVENKRENDNLPE